MGFCRQGYWSGLPFPPPGDLPNPGIEPWSPALQSGSLLSEPLALFFSFIPQLSVREETLSTCQPLAGFHSFSNYLLSTDHLPGFGLMHGVNVLCLVVPDSATPRTVALQTPLSMGFSRQDYWSGLSCLPPGDLPNPGIELRCPTLQPGSSLEGSVLFVRLSDALPSPIPTTPAAPVGPCRNFHSSLFTSILYTTAEIVFLKTQSAVSTYSFQD